MQKNFCQEAYTMDAAQRRKYILQTLQSSSQPVSASALAKQLGVSRQIIVGDVALLRAGGIDISATPRGYHVIHKSSGLIKTLACRHSAGDMEAELFAMVDNGCTVLDVIVDHPVYGQLTGVLQLSNRFEISQFMDRSRTTQPLSLLTEGVHLHTLSCPDEAAYERVIQSLRSLGFLLEP